MKKLTVLTVFLLSIFTLTSCETSLEDEFCDCYDVTYEILDDEQTEISYLIEVNRLFIGCNTSTSIGQEADVTRYIVITECNLEQNN